MTRDRALELFELRDGALVNRRTHGKAKKGALAGWNHPTGYRRLQADGVEHPAHRIVWLIATGEWPGELDHINGDRLDNRLENLRVVTRKQNMKNQQMKKSNTSGVCGVGWDKEAGKWRAYISVNGRVRTIGRFECLSAAAHARRRAEREFGYHKNHGRKSAVRT